MENARGVRCSEIGLIDIETKQECRSAAAILLPGVDFGGSGRWKKSQRDAIHLNMIKNFIGTKPETQKRIGLKVSVNPVSTRRRFKCHMIVAILSNWYFIHCLILE